MQLPEFCCPRCKGPVQLQGAGYACPHCDRTYPIVMGIADFRIFPDRYISYEDDYKKAAFLLEQAQKDKLDFQGLVQLYWKITPEVTPDRAERFAQRVFALVDKGLENLREIEELSGRGEQFKNQALLEIGCGTGGFLAAAVPRFKQVVGCDIAFRWLVIARERHRALGLEIPLVCCCAEALPFRDNQFDLVVAENVIEHVKDQTATIKECRRVLNGGVLFLTTPNRFTLAPEPHVGVWGVGFLPRPWMPVYVHWRRGVPYRFLKVLSLAELKRLLLKNGFRRPRVTLPGLPQAEVEHLSARDKLALKVYEVARRAPLLRSLLFLIGPSFHVLCHTPKKKNTAGGLAP
ncbi:MAG TPA: methyltransferase domain-containing protein [Abditibacteriaceae bacterium]|nr:methyltransferase domain-containing protein [Abditibacteriaceae bacterium]